MADLLLSPYFHPTTICFVDDNESFLDSLELELPDTWATVHFVDAVKAKAFLNTPPPLPPLVDRCFSMTSTPSTTPVIHLDLGMIEQEIRHPDRFRRVSVALIDFSMPSINGLDLCAQLTDPYLKKALLTGVADEKTAVEAFNVGLIDRFIPKSGAGSVETIVQYIKELEQAYFAQHIARLKHSLAIDPPGFLIDPQVADVVNRILNSERLIEYYLVGDPDGFVCLRGDGSMVRIVIHDDGSAADAVSFARRHGAPDAVVAQLENRKRVAAFLDSPDHYSAVDPYPWRDFLIPAKIVRSNTTWYVGAMHDPPMDIEYDYHTSTYDAYRARLRASR